MQSANISELIDEAYSLIAPFVQKDPTKFCTAEEFETGVETLKTYCALRAQSVQGQLDGTIPSTTEAQRENSESLIDASSIRISDMGSMGNTMGGGPGGPGNTQRDTEGEDTSGPPDRAAFGENQPGGQTPQAPPEEGDGQTDEASTQQTGAQDMPRPTPPDGQGSGTAAQSADRTQLLMLGGCVLALLLGLGFAVFYKKR